MDSNHHTHTARGAGLRRRAVQRLIAGTVMAAAFLLPATTAMAGPGDDAPGGLVTPTTAPDPCEIPGNCPGDPEPDPEPEPEPDPDPAPEDPGPAVRDGSVDRPIPGRPDFTG